MNKEQLKSLVIKTIDENREKILKIGQGIYKIQNMDIKNLKLQKLFQTFLSKN